MYIQTRDGLGQEVPLFEDIPAKEEEELLRRRDELLNKRIERSDKSPQQEKSDRAIEKAIREPRSSERSKQLSKAFNSVPLWYAPILYTRLRARPEDDPLSNRFRGLATTTRAKMLQILIDRIVKNCDCTGK